jgi:hypothetical protein
VTWLRLHLARARRRLTAALCYCDIHDLPAGFHRVTPAELTPGIPTWDVACRWCCRRFPAHSDNHAELLAVVERAMASHRYTERRLPARDRRPS